MRLSNFASVDPFHQQRGVKGLIGGIKQVQPIWNEFITNKEELLYESEQILAELEKQTIDFKYAKILEGTEHLKGETKLREVKTRVNQNTFRPCYTILLDDSFNARLETAPPEDSVCCSFGILVVFGGRAPVSHILKSPAFPDDCFPDG